MSSPELRGLVESLETEIRELAKPTEVVMAEQPDLYGQKKPDGLGLLVGELTMVAILLSSTDWNAQPGEIGLVNALQEVFFVYEPFFQGSADCMDLFRRFVEIYPSMLMTLDHPPISLRLLVEYDRKHGTEFSARAKQVFSKLASAALVADGEVSPVDRMRLEYYMSVMANCKATNEDQMNSNPKPLDA